MNKPFRPMLAATLDNFEQIPMALRSDMWCSPKLDGFRCLIREGIAVSRNLKPIPNAYVQQMLAKAPEGLDGELVVGSPTGELVFNVTSSGVTSVGGRPDFKFYVFDWTGAKLDWVSRYSRLQEIEHPFIEIVEHRKVASRQDFEQNMSEYLAEGYEGIMLRRGRAPYKYGRSTLNESYLLKHKEFTDGEAIIERVEEGSQNTNLAELDKTGTISRPIRREGLIPNSSVGTIIGRDTKSGATIVMSPGRMPVADRQMYWKYPERLIGRTAKYRGFAYGAVNALRFVTFQGFRHEIDT